jgi:pimeloyl-[acyl-carrier protein] methyl ester esterase
VSALNFEVSGRGRDLVLLHGWAMNLRVWDTLKRALGGRFRLIAVDLPGHGLSHWDPGASSPAAQAWRVHETLAPLTNRYTLIGWSLGGQIALDLAAALPAGVERLALIATTPRFLAAPGWRHGTAPGVLWKLISSLHTDRAHAMSEFLALQVRGCAPRTADRALSVLHTALALQGHARPAALMHGLERLRDADLRASLPAVRAPTLVIAGRLDRITRPEASRALAAALPQARYVEFARTAHVPFLTHTVHFITVLTRFLNA